MAPDLGRKIAVQCGRLQGRLDRDIALGRTLPRRNFRRDLTIERALPGFNLGYGAVDRRVAVLLRRPAGDAFMDALRLRAGRFDGGGLGVMQATFAAFFLIVTALRRCEPFPICTASRSVAVRINVAAALLFAVSEA
jgi:hypothetical protein